MADKIKIGVSGNKGSFSEEAANYYCSKENIENYELDYLVGVETVLQGLNDGKIEKAVFPVENSNGGIVYEAVYAMANHTFKIEKIFEIDIKMNLMVLPGTKKGNIKKIVSHPQALKQCRMYLKRNWPDAELEEYTDTASAAKDISEGVLPKDAGAIAPRICSEMYELDLIEEGIQDLKFNFTTFITATKK
ncbi:MAG: prephenate dehydratase [Patescibacteria group bacterium]|jgi:prephenate dehydratase|nr:prephenate dehydratase [Patescibacteria group bacterium]